MQYACELLWYGEVAADGKMGCCQFMSNNWTDTSARRSTLAAALGMLLNSCDGLVDAKPRDAGQQHQGVNNTGPAPRTEAAAPMADINVQPAAPARAEEDKARSQPAMQVQG